MPYSAMFLYEPDELKTLDPLALRENGVVFFMNLDAAGFAGALKIAPLDQFYIFSKYTVVLRKYNPKNNTGGAVLNNLMYVAVLVRSINTSPNFDVTKHDHMQYAGISLNLAKRDDRILV